MARAFGYGNANFLILAKSRAFLKKKLMISFIRQLSSRLLTRLVAYFSHEN